MRKRLLFFFLIAIFIVAMSYSQTITVTNPHGGENWVIGHTYTITWNSSGITGNVGIKLVQNGSDVGYIAQNVPNSSGSYSWTINNLIGIGPITPGSNYQIRVKKSGVTSGLSSGTFTITAPQTASITVTNPHGGECWEIGSTHTITWNSSGITGNVGIKLVQNGSDVGYIAQNVPNSSGSYSWTINNLMGIGPIVPGSNYQIRVKKSGVTSGLSSGTFSIKNSCSGGSTVNPGNLNFIAGLNLVELAVYMHGPGPRIRDLYKVKDILEKGNYEEPVTMRLMRGRAVIQDFGTFAPTIRRGHVSFNTFPTTLELKLSPEQQEMLSAHPEQFRFVVMSGEKTLYEKALKVQVREHGKVFKPINPQIIKIIKGAKAKKCPDLAVVDIKFNLLRKYSRYQGKVKITGIVKNIGNMDFISNTGVSIVLDYAGGGTTLKNIFVKQIKAGSTVTIEKTMDWHADDETREFPPNIRVYLIFDPDNNLNSNKNDDDCNPNNNKKTKSSKAINDMLK